MRFDPLATWPTTPGLQISASIRSRTSTARPPPSCRSRCTATMVRACSPSVDLERRQAYIRRQQVRRSVRDCLYYIGGIIKHAKALNAFTNPTTNSYKRLVPGFEAPVLLAYSAATVLPPVVSPTPPIRRRSASKSASRIRGQPLPRFFGDADGGPRRYGRTRSIRASRHGQGPLRSAAEEAERKSQRFAARCDEALEKLDKDRAFLKAGGVFDDDVHQQLHRIEDGRGERCEMTPHPIELDMYYSL